MRIEHHHDTAAVGWDAAGDQQQEFLREDDVEGIDQHLAARGHMALQVPAGDQEEYRTP